MKTVHLRILVVVAMIMVISSTIFAQTSKNYKDGSVWSVTFVKVKPNMGDDYISGLKTTWAAVNAEAVKEGLILSYKILRGSSSNPDDFDMILMQEFKNMAALDGNDDKWDAIEKKIIGGEDAMKTLNNSRVNMREIYGHKLLREVVYQ